MGGGATEGGGGMITWLRCLQEGPSGRRSRGRPRTRWRDYISGLAWEHLRIALEELVDVAEESHVWASWLKLLPHDPALD